MANVDGLCRTLTIEGVLVLPQNTQQELPLTSVAGRGSNVRSVHCERPGLSRSVVAKGGNVSGMPVYWDKSFFYPACDAISLLLCPNIYGILGRLLMCDRDIAKLYLSAAQNVAVARLPLPAEGLRRLTKSYSRSKDETKENT